MKTTAILTATLGLALGSLHAQTVPLFINYQGKVTDSGGVGLGTGTPVNRKVIFRIFDAATGGGRLWSEQHTVTISNGEFSVLLGNGINANYAGADEVPLKTATPLDTVFTSAGILRYVEIVVDNGDNTLNAGDAAIAPRQQITSTAYCFRARSADTIASGTDLQLNGSANYGLGYYGSTRLFNGAAVDGPVLFGQAGGALGSVNGGTKNIALRWNAAGAVGIGSADLSGAAATTKLVLQGDDANTVPLQLNIRGNSDTNKRLLLGYNTSNNYGSLQAYSGVSTATNLLLNPSGGNVGINKGASAPTQALDVTGNGLFSGSVTGSSFAGSGASLTGIPQLAGGNTFSGNQTLNGQVLINGAAAASKALQMKATDNGGGYYGLLSLQSFNAANPSWNIYYTDPTIYTNGGGLNFNDKVLFRNDGSVGIGTMAPTKGKVHINGGAGTNPYSGTIGYLVTSGAASSNLGTANSSPSLYANGEIWALAFFAQSDERIKSVAGRSDGASDLATLLGIEVTDYTYIDKIAKGNGKYKKVIAQQVEEVYPQAVRRSTDEVTDIYKKARIQDGWVMLATDLKKGERVRLIGEKSEGIHEVLEVEKNKFRTAFATEGDEVFVYGREVKDFRSVDYEAISMLNVSATQQIKKEKDAEVKALQEENAALRTRVAALEAKDQARDAKLSSIESLLLSPDKAAAVTVSRKQDTRAD